MNCCVNLLGLLIIIVFLNILKVATASEDLRVDNFRTVLKLQLDNARLQLENFDLREANKQCLHERTNGAALANNAEPSKRIQLDVDTFKNFFKEELSLSLKTFIKEQRDMERNLIKSVSERKSVSKNCAEAADGKVGVFEIKIPNIDIEPVQVACDSDNWMIILQRTDGSVDFDRGWAEYTIGFGNASGEHFLGLENIHQLTSSECHELKVELEDFEDNHRYAHYDRFEIGNKDEEYMLKNLGAYSGDAGDDMASLKSAKFSTYDRDNDELGDGNCAEKYNGAWWHRNCVISYYSKLTGLYKDGGDDTFWNGIEWHTWRQQYSYKSAKMLIRPCP